MERNRIIYSLILILSVYLFINSCEQEPVITNSSAKLNFSTDTVTFDTVFTTIGSTTKRFTVKNPHDKKIEISSIQLAGGNKSDYRLNINGIQSSRLENVEIQPKDSMYIFVEVTVDPNNANNPMVIKDSVIFNTNGNQQDVKLVSWGQDMHLINGEILSSQYWEADKPYLIYNSALVDTGQTLEIEEGAQIHFHKNSALYVAGTILANGSLENPIVFQGDRLEHSYEDIPGQWVGIYLTPGSKANRFNYVEIKNGIFGIWADTLSSTTEPTLTISNSKIQHMTSVGLRARGSTVKASNCLISDCGDFAVSLELGGSYEFYHCTIANYWGTSTRNTPSININNFYVDTNQRVQTRPLEKALFANSIIYGNRDNELGLDPSQNSAVEFNYTFDHCLMKVNKEKVETNNSHFKNVIFNEAPKFISAYEFNYQLDTLSPAINEGDPQIGETYPYDILNNSRIMDKAPDLGAYERIPNQEDN